MQQTNSIINRGRLSKRNGGQRGGGETGRRREEGPRNLCPFRQGFALYHQITSEGGGKRGRDDKKTFRGYLWISKKL